MATSGPGWEGIDAAWDWMQWERAAEQARREREAGEAKQETTPPPP